MRRKRAVRVLYRSCGRAPQTRENAPHNRVNEMEVFEFTDTFNTLVIVLHSASHFRGQASMAWVLSLQVDFKRRMRSRCFPSKHVSAPKKTVKLKATFSFGQTLCPQKNTCFPLASCSLCPSSCGSLRNRRIRDTGRKTLFLISAKLHLVIQSCFQIWG